MNTSPKLLYLHINFPSQASHWPPFPSAMVFLTATRSLLSSKGSWSTLRVIATLNESGLQPDQDYEFADINMSKGEGKGEGQNFPMKKNCPLAKYLFS